MDLNPVAFAPSATIPHIPNTERRDTLKIYGDAPVTVSDVRVKVAPVAAGSAAVGAFWTWYTMSGYEFTLLSGLSATTNCPLYPSAVIPLIRKGVSTSKPDISVDVLTVILVVGVTPSPALILEIPADTPVEPTILNSSILGWISRAADGKSGSIARPDDWPYTKLTFS